MIERAAWALGWVANALMLRNIGRRFYSAMEMIDTRLHLGRRGGEGDDMFCRKCGAEMEGGARFNMRKPLSIGIIVRARFQPGFFVSRREGPRALHV